MRTRHQAGAQYSAAECAKDRVAVYKGMAPATSHFVSSKRRIKEPFALSFFRSDCRCRQYVTNVSRIKTRYFGVAQKDSGLLFRQVAQVLPSCY